MDGNIDKVREDIYEAISLLRKVRHGKKLLPISHCAIDRLDKALAALSTIDPEVIRRECAEKAVIFVDNNYNAFGEWDRVAFDDLRSAILSAETAQDDGKPESVQEANDERIRRECADRAWNWFCGKSTDNYPPIKESLYSAIKTEVTNGQ